MSSGKDGRKVEMVLSEREREFVEKLEKYVFADFESVRVTEGEPGKSRIYKKRKGGVKSRSEKTVFERLDDGYVKAWLNPIWADFFRDCKEEGQGLLRVVRAQDGIPCTWIWDLGEG